MPTRVYGFIAVTVTAVWALLNLVDALSVQYIVPTQVNYTMGTLVGATFGAAVLRGRGGNS